MLSTSSGKVMLSASQTMKNDLPPVLRALACFVLRSPYFCFVGFGLVELPRLLLPLLLLRLPLPYRPVFSTALVLALLGVALLPLFLLAPGAAEAGWEEAAAAGALPEVARFPTVAIASAAVLELVLTPTAPPLPPPPPVNGATRSGSAGKGSTAAAATATLDMAFFLGDRDRFVFFC